MADDSNTNQIHEIDIGSHVHSSDGENLGKVEQLIIHGGTGRIDGFLLDTGVTGTKKIVETEVVASADASGVVLKLDAAASKDLPPLIEEQMLKAPDNLTYGTGMGYTTMQGGGDTWFLRGSSGGDLPHTGAQPFFFQAPVGNVITQNISSLPDEIFLVSNGTNVVGSDFKKIGKVDRVVLDDNQVVTGVVVKAGLLFKHDIHVPRSMIVGASHKQVRLNVSSAEAKRLPES